MGEPKSPTHLEIHNLRFKRGERTIFEDLSSSRPQAIWLLLPMLALFAGCLGASAERPDPFESVNRGIFEFNNNVDLYALEPAAKGWSFITPEAFRIALGRFFQNLKFPVRFLTNLGQGKVKRSGSELARFITNTTVGLLGFFDPASRFGLGKYPGDFGLMFGRWGVPSGPYWVIPLVGPSNPRDGVGYVFDSVLNPLALLNQLALVSPVVAAAGTVTSTVNGRALAEVQVDLARAAALDLYIFVRDASIQRRIAQIRNQDRFETDTPQPDEDDLYDIPDDLYELEDEPNEVEPDGLR